MVNSCVIPATGAGQHAEVMGCWRGGGLGFDHQRIPKCRFQKEEVHVHVYRAGWGWELEEHSVRE